MNYLMKNALRDGARKCQSRWNMNRAHPEFEVTP